MLETARIWLREWKDEDEAPFAQMNADPRVMEFFASTMTLEETRAAIERAKTHIAQYGFGLYAMEEKSSGLFLGVTGVFHPYNEAAYTKPAPCYEIGWRLAYAAWGKGYATEAAQRCLVQAFEEIGAPEVVAVTAVRNLGSRRVMDKLGMRYCVGEDFDHPKVPQGNPNRRSVVYRRKP